MINFFIIWAALCRISYSVFKKIIRCFRFITKKTTERVVFAEAFFLPAYNRNSLDG